MTLTKEDLIAIKKVVDSSTGSRFEKIDKKLVKIEKKFDELFDFLDRKYLLVFSGYFK